MIVVHRGIDNLDIAFQAQISAEFAEMLETAKNAASDARGDAQSLEYMGNRMHVAESGGSGGYAYRADIGPMGATWFFKKPNPKDPWGIRVSSKSLPLAVNGLAAVRSQIDTFLSRMGIEVSPQGVSIGRIDFTVDILAPGFVLNPDHLIMPPRANFDRHREGSEKED